MKEVAEQIVLNEILDVLKRGEAVNSKLRNVSTGALETVSVDTEYVSPDQHGGLYGTVYRQYHGAKSNGNTISITGITKLIDYGGSFDTNAVYRGYTHDGTNYIGVVKGTDQVTFNISTWTLNTGWIDYTK